MFPKAHLTSHPRMFGFSWVITPLWLSGLWRSFLYSSYVYSCHLFLIYSASVRSIPFLSFTVPIFAWNVPLMSLIFLKRSLVFPILLFRTNKHPKFHGCNHHLQWFWSHEIKRCLLLGRKVMTHLDSVLKSRDVTLPTKVCLVIALAFPVVMYGCESWTIKRAEHRRIDAFKLWCWRRLESPLDSKEIQSVHPKGYQSWMFIGRTVEA